MKFNIFNYLFCINGKMILRNTQVRDLGYTAYMFYLFIDIRFIAVL